MKMSELAQRLYYRQENKRKETEEEKAYKMVQKYNSILRMIEKVNDAKTFVQCKNTISSFAKEVGETSLEVIELTGKLNTRIKSVADDIQKNIDKINEEIEEIKKDSLNESTEYLQELNTIAEQRLLQYMIKLDAGKDNNARNKRKIGNYVALVEKSSDRANAMALVKLATLPQFSDCFTQRQKEIIAEKSLNPAHIVFERNKEMLIKEKSSQLGALYMRAFNIRNIKKKITNADSAFYFNKDREE